MNKVENNRLVLDDFNNIGYIDNFSIANYCGYGKKTAFEQYIIDCGLIPKKIKNHNSNYDEIKKTIFSNFDEVEIINDKSVFKSTFRINQYITDYEKIYGLVVFNRYQNNTLTVRELLPFILQAYLLDMNKIKIITTTDDYLENNDASANVIEYNLKFSKRENIFNVPYENVFDIAYFYELEMMNEIKNINDQLHYETIEIKGLFEILENYYNDVLKKGITPFIDDELDKVVLKELKTQRNNINDTDIEKIFFKIDELKKELSEYESMKKDYLENLYNENKDDLEIKDKIIFTLDNYQIVFNKSERESVDIKKLKKILGENAYEFITKKQIITKTVKENK